MHITSRCVNALKIDAIKMYLGFPITIVSSHDYGRNVCEEWEEMFIGQTASKSFMQHKNMQAHEGFGSSHVGVCVFNSVRSSVNEGEQAASPDLVLRPNHEPVTKSTLWMASTGDI